MKEINWDKLFQDSSFKAIADLSPEFSAYPSVFSPCGQFYYVSSLDIGVDITSLEQVQIAMDAVDARFADSPKLPFKKFAKLHSDKQTLAIILHEDFGIDSLFAFDGDGLGIKRLRK